MIKPIGHDNTLKTLEKIAISKKIPHSYIFSGIEGIGKKLAALYFGKILNCEEKESIPCNSCYSCKKIDKNIHPDILILDTEKKQITIEMIREIITFAQTNPFEGKYKVAIINDAHKLNQFASNALLKTIEEPYSSTIFILITHSLNRVLPTIQSRCIKISFSPLDNEKIKEILLQEGYDIEKIEEIIEFTDGSVLQAKNLLKEDVFNDITNMKDFLTHLKTKNFIDINNFCEEISKKNREELFFSLIIKNFYNKIHKNANNPNFDTLNKYQKTINFHRNLRYNINKAFLLETLLLTLQK
ncbi:MAG: DNA polymerase III subunit delta' [Proteobacteria bacterium]|nr:DNA polymerase III subunit delta' [Pseudomonadota bacterium]